MAWHWKSVWDDDGTNEERTDTWTHVQKGWGQVAHAGSDGAVPTTQPRTPVHLLWTTGVGGVS